MCICVYIYIYIYTYVHIYIYMYIYVYINEKWTASHDREYSICLESVLDKGPGGEFGLLDGYATLNLQRLIR